MQCKLWISLTCSSCAAHCLPLMPNMYDSSASLALSPQSTLKRSKRRLCLAVSLSICLARHCKILWSKLRQYHGGADVTPPGGGIVWGAPRRSSTGFLVVHQRCLWDQQYAYKAAAQTSFLAPARESVEQQTACHHSTVQRAPGRTSHTELDSPRS